MPTARDANVKKVFSAEAVHSYDPASNPELASADYVSLATGLVCFGSCAAVKVDDRSCDSRLIC